MTAPRKAAFAIPGDIETLTGGYIYEHRLLMGLRDQGRNVEHVQLPEGFPDVDAAAMAQAIAQLQAVEPERVLILDGLVFGSIDSSGLAGVRAPIVAMIHHPLAMESGLDPARRQHLFTTERDNLRLAQHVLVPSPHTRDLLVARYDVPPERITIARPGVDPPRYPSAPVARPLILSVGILHPRKGHDLLIDALARIGDLDWQTVIIGSPWDPAHAEALALQAEGSGLGARLRLAGRVTTDELHRHYASASVFALATRYEGYGIVFDEALSYGLPIVSCATGAVPQTVPADTALLVPPEDSEAFADALRLMLTDERRRQACAGAARSAAQHLPDWSQTAAAAGAVLDRIG
ncbi:glycosyltransferase family 4 protein [Paracoccus zhejiangensis]|uniref:Glycosyl transferase family 1 n=1 Tax=Paracoccus zhejiangensis TaxID=1077935 RepID=A0A2H5F0G1_9RHOB|nr:glycosyltransferase family 4 protein [Paracoccus zhejiangensis]AUH65020.1 glycosyl transferase family 1 [Paracoccus zhejiangensis]